MNFPNQRVSSMRKKLACVPIEDSEQPAHPHSLIRVFDGRSIASQESSISSGRKLSIILYSFESCLLIFLAPSISALDKLLGQLGTYAT